ncbi:MAG: hypothetical protein CMO80_13350 [Verrucomicrobiales bacterium]|nr:hypothetical protein [Verrucomicrobiales bacterium]|tara:strand:- start:1979 stop:4522 length:2544 start_codon:yes stop_codon:yes gene_type:complete
MSAFTRKICCLLGMAVLSADSFASDHWAFKAPSRPRVPATTQKTNLSSIDAFILARLEKDQLGFNQAATAGEFIRRASFDLIGLPPSREEVLSFKRAYANDTDLAVRQLIDRLLASPHYGERWGRHWLDLARYADSNGFEFDFERPLAWRYRDWVIDAFNSDKPYDRFLMEQLAGDELAPRDFAARVATGFCRNGPTVGNQKLEKYRWDELDDVISTTAEVFMGLTIGCARCHDHMTDPIPQRDYYAMLAIFNSMENRNHFMGTPAQTKRLQELKKEIQAVQAKIKKLGTEPSAGEWSIEAGELVQSRMAPNVRMIFGDADWQDYTLDVEVMMTRRTDQALTHDAGLAVYVRASDLTNFYALRLGVSDNREHGLAAEHHGGRISLTTRVAGTVESDQWHRVRVKVQGERIQAWMDDRKIFDLRDRRHQRGGIGFGNWLATSRWRNLRVVDDHGKSLLAGLPNPDSFRSPAYIAPPETKEELTRRKEALEHQKNLLPNARSIADRSREARETRFFHRGDHRTPGKLVDAGVPRVFGAVPVSFPAAPSNAKTTGRRTAFARWLVSPDHPTTARVMVNRIWQYHFGRGLVDTPSNFGLNGSRPSHPDLLDWLAVEFIESGWSVKHMHRLIVNSAVYRQSSRRQALPGNDPANRLLWRFPKRRLEGELIRDRILASSGSLNSTMHGPGIRPRIHPGVIATSTTRKWPAIERETSEHWRRSVYVHVRRSVMMPMLEAFDAPTTTESCERRVTTTVATQALQLLNDQFTNEQAELMAQRIVDSGIATDDARIDAVWWLAFSRATVPAEREDCREFLRRQLNLHSADSPINADLRALTDLCLVAFNLNEFVYVD